ncbi:hypothetical protein OSB04_005309 [Centaurea solstitialis]|uniref:Leucine-rich repeat-containing N-terminal plant-type domain-containing protein n=1 Tax=Centaurea solstitialis TaxID=347529 RepID=A0AA38WRC8_9ASTR|nr:hypothetical protein OSB04_005309 [Centaurea solstitialis]
MFPGIRGGCIEEERKALLEIKASLISYGGDDVDHLLPTWSDEGSECCEWERVKCNSSNGHVTDLAFKNLGEIVYDGFTRKIWELNVSVFLHFKQLRSLNLSSNFLDNVIEFNTGIGRLSSLKKLEMLDLSNNHIDSDSIFNSMGALTSLKILDLSSNLLGGNFPADELAAMENLQILDLTFNCFSGTFEMQGFENFSGLRKLEILNLGHNCFDESIFPSLSVLPSLNVLNLKDNDLSAFPTKVRFVSDNDKFEVETEEPLGWIPMFQLKVLVLSNCNLNKGSRNVPSFLLYQHKLQVVELSHNSLDGTFPNWLIENNTRLEDFNLKNNSFSGNIHVPPYRNVNTWHLDLSDNHLTGMIPSDLGNILPYITHLNLSWNSLDGALPLSMGNLSGLQVLDLSDNKFSREIPKRWLTGHCPSLYVLHLSNNKLDGEVLPKKLNTSQLSILLLANNRFTGLLPNEISEGSSILRMLDIGGNLLSGVIPPWIGNLTSLDALVIRNNMFEGQFPCGSIPSCSGMQIMEHLHLESNRFTGSIPESFRNLTSLLTLDMGNNKLSGIGRLSSLKKLEMLDLSMSYIEESSIFASLGALTSLKILDLSYSLLSGDFPAHELAAMENLQILDLTVNGFSGTFEMQGFESRSGLRKLEILNLGHNFFDESIFPSLSALPSLKVLNISDNQFEAFPAKVFCKLKNLHELHLSDNKFEGEFPPCFSSSSLKLFDLSLNEFSGNFPSLLISNLTSLEYIDLSHNKFEGLISMGSLFNHTKLEVVEFISDNDKFEVETEEPLGWMPTFQLKVLVLSNCNLNKGSRNVPSFLLYQHKLQVVELSHNSLDGTFPNWLIENNTRLEDFNLKNNSFSGTIHVPPYRNVNTWHLDLSDNHLTGMIPSDLGNILPYITHLNLSWNSLDGALPLSMGNLSGLQVLDLSDNKFSGEIPKRWLTGHCPSLYVLHLSNNKLDGEVLPKKLNTSQLSILLLANNRFTGLLPNEISEGSILSVLDIGGNLLSGVIPPWIGNLTSLDALVIRNNMFKGQFPCGNTLLTFLDISKNSFSGSIPSCSGMQIMEHLHLESNRFTGSIPESFRNLTSLLTLDMGNNKLSGRIPNFLGELSSLIILFLRRNKFIGAIPKPLCRLSNVNLIDLSSNSLSASIPNCLQNITGPSYRAFVHKHPYPNPEPRGSDKYEDDNPYERQDAVQFITKSRLDTYKGGILDYMSGIDLSCNNLTGEIPKELGLLSQIHAMNLSHNQLTGPIPSTFSNLENIESLDISSNRLSGRVPSELLVLHNLAVFVVANNNLSGRLPEMKGQFGTFNVDSYVGNPFLCGPPLEKNCTRNSTLMTPPLLTEEKWYFMDMVSFGASLVSAWFVFLMGFAGVLYVNPYWRRRWLDFIEECMYTGYYFLCDCFRKRRF